MNFVTAQVTVLASSVETYVKSQEQSREQDTARHMATYSNQLEELRAEVTGALGRLGRVDEDNQTLLEKLNNLSGRLAALDSKDGEFGAHFCLSTISTDIVNRMTIIVNQVSWRQELVRQLQSLEQGWPPLTTREEP